MLQYEHGGDIYNGKNFMLDFSVNTNPLGMPETVKRALLADLDSYVRYPDPHCRALTEAIANMHGVSPDCILCGNGASDLLLRITACKRPKTALTLAPTFSEYERCVRLFGGKIKGYALSEASGFATDESVFSALTPETDMVFLCNPNNPTGRLTRPELLLEIAAFCQRNGTVLVVDECFLPFTNGASILPYIGAFPNLLVLRAFTKLYALAGLRLGYLIGADAEGLKAIGTYGAQWNVSIPAQTAGVAALLAEPDWTAHTQSMTVRERKFMAQSLTALGLTVFPSDANLLLIKSRVPLYEKLLAQGILMRDCSNFSGLDERFIRIGLKTHPENEALLRAVSEALHG